MLKKIKREIYLRFKCTDMCNLACTFCHQEGISAFSSNKMSLSFFKRVISVMNDIGLYRIKFTGGEPTLCQNIDDYIGISSKLTKARLGIVTNGYGNNRIIDRLMEKYKDLDITISLPGLTESNYRERTNGGDLKNTYLFDEIKKLIVSSDALVESIKKKEEKNNDNLLRRIVLNHIILNKEDLTDEWYKNIILLAERVKRIKLLIPCNVKDLNISFDSVELFNNLNNFLKSKGFQIIDTKDNHVFYSNGKLNNIIIAPPYCPHICATSEHITLRLTSSGVLKPCFIENSKNIQLEESMSDAEIKKIITNLVEDFVCPYANQEVIK